MNAAGLRTAVSRAYYAVHHVARAFVEEAGVRLKRSGEAHADVWNHLANSGDVQIDRLGYTLSELHSNRIDADYLLHIRAVEDSNTAAALVTDARALVEIIVKCRADRVRFENVKKAIRTRHAVLRGLSTPDAPQ